MPGDWTWIAVAGGALAVAILAVALARGRARAPAAEARPALTVDASGRARVTLELEDADPASPVVRRLVHDAAARVFALLPDAVEVEVRARGGRVLGRVSRRSPPPPRTEVPPPLYEPRPRRAAGPDPTRHLREEELSAAGRAPVAAGPPEPPPRTLLDRFDLPPSVRDRVRSPDDPADLLRAVLEAAGIPHRLDRDLVLAGDTAIAVVEPDAGVVVGHDALNHAYLRIAASGAARGLVIALGYVDPREVERREMAAPQVRHAGPDAIQRMADAAALGADPLRFALAIPVRAAG